MSKKIEKQHIIYKDILKKKENSTLKDENSLKLLPRTEKPKFQNTKNLKPVLGIQNNQWQPFIRNMKRERVSKKLKIRQIWIPKDLLRAEMKKGLATIKPWQYKFEKFHWNRASIKQVWMPKKEQPLKLP